MLQSDSISPGPSRLTPYQRDKCATNMNPNDLTITQRQAAQLRLTLVRMAESFTSKDDQFKTGQTQEGVRERTLECPKTGVYIGKFVT